MWKALNSLLVGKDLVGDGGKASSRLIMDPISVLLLWFGSRVQDWEDWFVILIFFQVLGAVMYPFCFNKVSWDRLVPSHVRKKRYENDGTTVMSLPTA